MEELNICPSTLVEGFQTYSPAAVKLLFDGNPVSHILPFRSPNNEEAENEEYAKHVGRVSLSGVQPKAGLIIKGNQLVIPSEQERSRYILKPAPSSYALLERKDCPANEHLSMQLASQVYHIETAPNALCFFSDGEQAYITRRFDVAPDGSKYQQEDFASLAGLTKAHGGSDYKYSNLSYEECAEIIGKYTTAPSVEILKFFRMVVFNYLILNDDAHLKNFSLINRGDGDEGMHLTDTRTVTRVDFEEFGRRIGLATRLVKRELDNFATEQPLAKELINRSFLSDKLKKYYWQSYNYRRTTLQ